MCGETTSDKVRKSEMTKTLFLEAISIISLGILAVSVADRKYGTCFQRQSNVCGYNSFRCFDGTCISKSHYCDKQVHCPDGSDEKYCGGHFGHYSSCPNDFIRCRDTSDYRCIPKKWQCDGFSDCPYNWDELNCEDSESRIQSIESLTKGIQWLKNRKVAKSSTRKWSSNVDKVAVAFYLSDPAFSYPNNTERNEITYELSIQLLSRLVKRKIENTSSSDLASFVNAFLVTCIDPRDFHGFNLVQELRSRVEKQNYTNPYFLLTLCNAGDNITESDIRKLIEIFWINDRVLWTDVQAMSLMALSCARNQTASIVDAETIKELALELKQHQYRNGTVENLRNTLLAMQALYAAEFDEDPDNFDERKALSYIFENQQYDGSFGNLLQTYYALPVLNCRSMVNISSSHCPEIHKDEDNAMFDLVNYVGPKQHVRYSVWIGNERDIERVLTLRVPVNASFYRVIEIAAEIDNRFKFDYVVKDRKPYITSVSGIQDDLETEQFWFPYITPIRDEKPTALNKSTVDVITGEYDHIIMWYRKKGFDE